MSIRARKKMRTDSEIYVEKSPEVEHEETEKDNDFMNICLLMFLYVMQGIPLGLASSVPLIIQSSSKTASFSNQGTFSLALWPFSLKLLWAPIVDSVYSTRFGRRKCWLIPTQYAIGINLLVLASHVDEWLGRAPGNPWGPLGVTHPVDIVQLTIAFFGLTMLAATQDIAVDGWALTMLSKKNLGWASTCNTVGQNFGNVVTYTLLLSLESPEICNTYLRFTPVEGQGLISYSGFLYFWGIVFLVTTTIVALLKHEVDATVTKPVHDCLNRMSAKLNTANTSCCRGNPASRSSLRLRRQNIRQFVDGRKEATSLDPSLDRQVDPDDDAVSVDEEEAVRLLSDYESSGEIGDLHGSGLMPTNILEVKLIDPADGDAEEWRRSHSPSVVSSNHELSMLDTYKVMIGVLRLKPILLYIFMLFASKISFSAVDSITILKLIECGVTKERLAFLQVLLYPFHAVLPLMIIRWTNGPRPLNFYCLSMLPRLVIGCLWIPLIYFAPSFQTRSPAVESATSQLTVNLSEKLTTEGIPNSLPDVPELVGFTWSFYALILTVITVYSVFATAMAVTTMAFHARISDPSVGGTYMTLVNTASNLAGVLPSTLMYYLVEPLTIRSCDSPNPLEAGLRHWRSVSKAPLPSHQRLIELGQGWLDERATCKLPYGIKACTDVGGTCRTRLDGFYAEVVACFLLGLVVLPMVVRPLARRLDSLPTSAYSFRLPSTTKCCSGPRQWFHRWPFSMGVRGSTRPRKPSDNE